MNSSKEMSFDLRNKFWSWTIGRPRMSTFPPKLHSGPLLIIIFSSPNRSVYYFRIRQLYSSVILCLEMANSNFPLLFWTAFPRLYFDCFDLIFLRFSVVARKLSMTGSIQIFEKFHFTPKLRCSCCSRSNFQI